MFRVLQLFFIAWLAGHTKATKSQTGKIVWIAPADQLGDDWTNAYTDIMQFYINSVNADPAVLPTINLTLSVYHTNDPTYSITSQTTSRSCAQAALAAATQSVLAIIGPSYSSYCRPSIPLTIDTYIPFCDGGSTSSLLSDKTEYPNFFRTIPTDAAAVNAMLDLVNHNGWTHLGILSETTTFGQQLTAQASIGATSRNLKVLSSRYFTDDASLREAISDIRASGVRVIMLMLQLENFKRAYRQLYAAGMWGSGYQYIVTDGISLIFNDFSSTALSSQELAHMAGLFMIYPVEQYGPKFSNFLSAWLASGRSEDAIYPYSMFTLSCVQLIVNGLNQFYATSPPTVSTSPAATQNLFAPSTDGSGNPLTKPLITNIFSGIDTVTGTVSLDGNGDRQSAAYTVQYGDPSTSQFITFGEITDGLYKSLAHAIYLGGEQQKPTDYIPLTTFSPYSQPLGQISAALHAVSLLSLVMSFSFIIRRRNTRLVKSSSLVALSQIFVGSVLCYIGLYLYMAGSINCCKAYMYLLAVGWGLIFGALLFRAFLVFRIFKHAIVGAEIQNRYLMQTMAVVIVEICLAVGWQLAGVPTVALDEAVNVRLCNVTHPDSMAIVMTPNIVIILAAVVMSTLTRNVSRPEYRDNRAVGLTVYNALAVTIVFGGASFAISSQMASNFLFDLAIWAIITSTWAIMYLPLIFVLWKNSLIEAHTHKEPSDKKRPEAVKTTMTGSTRILLPESTAANSA